MKLTAFLVVLAAFPFTGFTQYYPVPQPINPEKRSELLLKLKNSSADTNRVHCLLDLCTLYSSRPLGIRANCDTAMRFASRAAELSASLHFPSGYNNALYSRARLYVQMDDLSSAKLLLAKVQDTTRLNFLLLLSFATTFVASTNPEYDSAADFAREAYELSEQFRQREKKVMALQDMVFCALNQNSFSAADSLLSVAIKDDSVTGHRELQHIYFLFGCMNYRKAKYDTALYYGLQSIKAMQATKDTLRAGDYYLLLAFVYNSVGKQDLSIQYSMMAIKSYTVHSGEFSLFEAISEANAAMTRLGQKKEALAFLQKSFAKFTPQNYDDSSFAIDALCGYYIAVKNYDKAEKLRLQHLRSAIQRKMANGTDYVATGDVFIQGQQYAKAKPYLLKALHSESYHPLVVEQALIEYYLFLCDSAEGNYISAIRHLDLNKMLDDSSNKISRNKEIQRLDIQFQTEKKETDLKLKDQNIQLLTQKSQVQQADLHQANLIKDITIAGILLLLAGGGLLFRQYRQKQRASQIISSQNELISRKNELLEHLVSEKDWLLKEVHHRVKNNLHTVICLLESQAYYLENDALNAIATTQHRIYAMSLIHQKIYQSEDIKTLDMANYMSEFIQYLRDSFGGLSRIRFMLDIENLTLGVSQAIPVALIVNEAVTNSIKYAFPMNTWGEIAIQLHQTGGQVRLSVSDNGVGIDPEIKNTEQNSLGIQLMKGLSREIYGTFSFESGKGVRILVLFDQDPLGETVTAASPIVNILR